MAAEKLYLSEEYVKKNIMLCDECNSDLECYEEGGSVLVRIEPTGTLEQTADKLRKADGLRPLFGAEADPDEEGWYNFDVVLYKDRVDGIAVETMFPNDGADYYCEISCTDDTNKALYGRMRELFSDDEWERIWDMEVK